MRLIDHDVFTGITTLFDYDDLTDTTTIKTVQDVEGQLEASKSLASDEDYTKSGFKHDMWHYAHIPNGIIQQWLVEKGVDIFKKDDNKKVFQLLNDPEYRHLKTTHKFHQPKT